MNLHTLSYAVGNAAYLITKRGRLQCSSGLRRKHPWASPLGEPKSDEAPQLLSYLRADRNRSSFPDLARLRANSQE